MRLLFIGDVFGAPGLRTLETLLPELTRQHRPDLIVANGENASGGVGITAGAAERIFSAGVEVITTGNHVWDKREMLQAIERMPRVLRPANLTEETPGRGYYITRAAGVRVGIVNLLGRVFLSKSECPFRTADRLLEKLKERVDIVFVDIHAEATSEKQALAFYLDGRVGAVIGTHTHVPTADGRILPGGTGYLTDVGMTGVRDSVIGVRPERAIDRFLTGLPQRLGVQEGRGTLMGALLEFDGKHRCTALRRVEAVEP